MFEKIKNNQKLRSGIFLLLFMLFFIITIGITVNNNDYVYESKDSDIENTDVLATLNNNYHYGYYIMINNDSYQIDGYKYRDLLKETYYKNNNLITNIEDITQYYNFIKLDNLKKLTNKNYLKNNNESDEMITSIYQISNKNINMILLSDALNEIIVTSKENTSIEIELTLDNYFSEVYNETLKVKITIIYDQLGLITENMMQ